MSATTDFSEHPGNGRTVARLEQLQTVLEAVFVDLLETWEGDDPVPFFAVQENYRLNGTRKVTELVFIVRRGPIELAD